VISTEIASVVARFCDGHKGSTHDELSMFFAQTKVAAGDPGTKMPDGSPIGKMKRVRRVLTYAMQHEPDAGSRLVLMIVDSVRASGGFHEGSDGFVGVELMDQARRGFAALGYEFDAEGHVRPATLENLHGVEMTEALWTYVRRARAGVTDSPLAVGTAKDLAEAAARHVLVETTGDYPVNMNFAGTLYQAYDRLGMSPPVPSMFDQLDGDGRVAVRQALYLLVCAVNKLRNQEGAGHGRPQPSTLDKLDARLGVQAAGLAGELLLTILEEQQSSLVGAPS